MNTKENLTDVASCGSDLKRDREKIDLLLHEPELLCNPNLWQNPIVMEQQIQVLEDDTQVKLPKQEHAVHNNDRCIARYSTLLGISSILDHDAMHEALAKQN